MRVGVTLVGCVVIAAADAYAGDVRLGNVRAGDSAHLASNASPVSGTALSGRDHDVHVSVSRVAVEGSEIFWRIRCFADDLELALRQHIRDSTFAFARSRSDIADSLVLGYTKNHLQLSADGVPLAVRLIRSGTEADESGEQVRWYVLSFSAPAPPESLRIRHAMLFDVYRDQQNLVTLMHSATNRRLPLYFTAGNDIAQTVTFDKP